MSESMSSEWMTLASKIGPSIWPAIGNYLRHGEVAMHMITYCSAFDNLWCYCRHALAVSLFLSVVVSEVTYVQDSPVDASINEFYLWHGCKPEGAEGITDANFDIKRGYLSSKGATN